MGLSTRMVPWSVVSTIFTGCSARKSSNSLMAECLYQDSVNERYAASVLANSLIIFDSVLACDSMSMKLNTTTLSGVFNKPLTLPMKRSPA
jgi:hypothetical protein